MSTNSVTAGFRIVDLDQLVEAAVRHAHHAHVRFNGAEGVVGRFGAGVGDGVKDGGLAHVGEAYDTAFKTHDNLRFMATRKNVGRSNFFA